MDTAAAPKFLFLIFVLSIPIFCSSAAVFLFPVKHVEQQLHQAREGTFYSSRKQKMFIAAKFGIPMDTSVPGTVTIPPAGLTPATVPPVTNPVSGVPGSTTPAQAPPDAGFPGSTTPAQAPPVAGFPGSTTPAQAPPVAGFPGSTTPAQAPPVAGFPGSTTPAQAPPVAGFPGSTTPAQAPPVAGFPGSTTPTLNPPVAGTTPAMVPPAGQSWCIAKNGAPETTVQVALDYACGSGADCSAVQQGGACYNPNTLQNHASYAFNSYYQKNPAPTSCDFGSVAVITNANPSTGSCIFPTSPPTTASPATMTPAIFTPPPAPAFASPTTTNPAASIPPPSNGATPTSSGISPNILNASSPGLGGFADSPASTTSDSMSPYLQPSTNFFILLTIISIITVNMYNYGYLI